MKKIILVAYDLNPKKGSECGIADIWTKIVSKHYSIKAIVDSVHKKDILSESYSNVKFHFVETNKKLRKILGKMGAFNISYNFFIKKAKPIIKKILQHNKILLIHCITPEGIHSYNDLYKFNVPILIGPLGGGLDTPKGFEQVFKHQLFKNIIREFYYKQITKKKKWRDYFLNAEKIIIGTEYVKNKLPKEVQNKCVVIFDALVDVNFYTPNFDKRDNNVKKILFVGRLESNKGIVSLIEAIKECKGKEREEKFLLEIIGDGSLRKKIRYLISKYNLHDVIRMYGKLEKQEVIKKYQNSDILVLPTLREPGGRAILEAMACGLPVITSDYGGPKYSVTDDCGIKVKVENYKQYVNDLAEAIIKLLKNDSLRMQMGINARKRVEKEFSMEAMERKILKVYQELIG